MQPTMIARKLVYSIEPFNPLVRPNVSLRNQGIGVVRDANENLDQVAAKLLDISPPRSTAFHRQTGTDKFQFLPRFGDLG